MIFLLINSCIKMQVYRCLFFNSIDIMRIQQVLRKLLKENGKFTLILVSLFSFLLISSHAVAQKKKGFPDSLQLKQEVDIFDVIRKWTGKPPKPENLIPKVGEKNLSLLPVIGYSPANGFVIGAAVSVTEFMGNPKSTNLSSAL